MEPAARTLRPASVTWEIPTEKAATVARSALAAESLVPHLQRCGYGGALLRRDYDFGPGTVPAAAFAHTPHDTRSACIAVVDAPSDAESAVASARLLGAPVVFACHTGGLGWWKQTTGTPLLIENIGPRSIRRFFDEHKKDFAPANIFEGKTRRRLPGQTQLSFVDAGLMPFVDLQHGEQLTQLVEAAFRDVERALRRKLQTQGDARNAIKATFWLLAARVLRDKGVNGFKTLDLADIGDVFARVGRHYGVPDGVPPPGKAWRRATAGAAQRIGSGGSLRNLSTESLAHVYENALVTEEVRKANGTHSTPGALVDYIVWQLWPWIEALPLERRHVFEPACGHGGFLVSSLRVLRQWSGIDDSAACHRYLKSHLHGVENDPFALEVAKLSLTLADAPHGNKWDLKCLDMFAGTTLEDGARDCGVLLANPPFERFGKKQRAAYAERKVTIEAQTKACEMLRRTIPHLRGGACFGVVVPLGFLHSKEGRDLRRTILSDFELAEIDVFEDKLFAKGDHEAAVLLGRRKKRNSVSGRLSFRRVRNAGMDPFRNRFVFSSEKLVETSGLVASATADMRVPELVDVWRYLSAYPVLGQICAIGQGLSHKATDCWTLHDPLQPGDPSGYANVGRDLAIYETPIVLGMNLDANVVLRFRSGRPPGRPQVLLNYASASREPWRLKATVDEQGFALTSNFLAVRPTAHEPTVLYWWALLNSPVANAFAYCTLGKRHNLAGAFRQMPVPSPSTAHAAQVEQAAMRYRTLASSTGPLYDAEATPERIHQALLEMDAAVLRAYDLPPRLERELLDLFAGVPRKGVGCTFTGYYPPGFTSCLPLHLVISDRFQRAAADATADRFRPGKSEYVRKVLAAASESKGD